MRRRNKKHYSIYIAWILLLLCVIGGLKAGIEESAVGKEQTHSEISIQSRWEELLKSVSEKKNDKKKDQKKSEIWLIYTDVKVTEGPFKDMINYLTTFGAEDRYSLPRTTCVIPIRWSSTTFAKL